MNGKRYSLKYANTPTDELLTLVQWRDVLAQYNGHCAYCGKKVKLTLDHIIPLSRGGKHSKDNVVPACSHCNSSKGTKTPEERFGLGVAS
jgi:5-methylcytosine-specific restriction endonuclease McrA